MAMLSLLAKPVKLKFIKFIVNLILGQFVDLRQVYGFDSLLSINLLKVWLIFCFEDFLTLKLRIVGLRRGRE
jgi:hypothetical protein